MSRARRLRRMQAGIGALLACALGPASSRSAPALVSPEVHPDHSVTFRLFDPTGRQLALVREGAAARVPMHRGDDGVWEVTTEPLEPDFYGYSFWDDGASLDDPNNAGMITPNLLGLSNQVHVPGGPGLPWELAAVPHGVIHHHFYHSAVIGEDRDYYVYTPPGYGHHDFRAYPVLYLLHGFSDDASGWTAVGRAHVILDNLIAAGRAKPMVIVMPFGYGGRAIFTPGAGGLDNPVLRDANYAQFEASLLQEVMPQVEGEYQVRHSPEDRAIAGLSMGGTESLLIGLNHPEKFNWVAAFSAGGTPPAFDGDFPRLTAAANRELRLLWIACGLEDRFLGDNNRLRAWLDQKHVRHQDFALPKGHTWQVWRRDLIELTPKLFRKG